MKKVLSLFLSAIMLITSALALPVLSYADEAVMEGIAFEVIMNFSLDNWAESITVTDFTFVPQKTDYYYVELEGNSFSLTVKNGADEVKAQNGYYLLTAGKTYALDFDFAGSQGATDFYENAIISGNGTYDEVAIATVCEARDSHFGTYEYDVIEGEISITAYKGNDAEVVIPDSIMGMTVTEIAGLETSGIIEKITIPASVVSIAPNAINPEATVYCIHNSAANDYAKEFGCTFYGTDEHVLSHSEIPASCYTEGSRIFTCDNCAYTESEPIAPHHTEVADEAVAPTCTEEGKTAGTHCSVCGEVITAQEAIPALGHDYQSVVNAPTCTESGYTTYTCSRCGSTYKSDEKEAVGHIWNDGEVTAEATCSAKGVKTFTCTVCGETKTEEIPEIDHTVVTDKAVAATFKAAGKTSGKHCSVCGKVITAQKAVAKLVSPTVSKLTAGKKSFTATWKKAPTVDGYQIQYATNKKFTKAKSVTIKKGKTTKTTVKKLKAKQKYFVRVRAYKTINGKKVYSAWSKAKTVTTKK